MPSKSSSKTTVKKRHCKNCDELTTGMYCDYCKKNKPKRCIWCGVILDEIGVCSTCALYGHVMLDKCALCGDAINQTKHRYKRLGNVCGPCSARISRKLSRYDGSYPYNRCLEDVIGENSVV